MRGSSGGKGVRVSELAAFGQRCRDGLHLPTVVRKQVLVRHLCQKEAANREGQQKDDGKGFSRKLVLRHTHEKNSGDTSSIKYDTIGFLDKKIINYDIGLEFGMENIHNTSDRLLNLIDLPGDIKYMKTILFGISSILLKKPSVIRIDTELNKVRFLSECMFIIFQLLSARLTLLCPSSK